ncbi:MAG: Fe-S cluster assembly protein SufB, partial [Deltaproteobacteria bacterium]|nr:Fe-S cluster assembly protein SufB [Deltaproteobacteria bacterium]
MSSAANRLETLTNREYKYGFVTEVEQDAIRPGLDEGIIRTISAKKGEPDWLLDWRLKAYRHWEKLA